LIETPMSAIPVPHISREEYLRRERLAPERSEYLGGRVVAMPPSNRNHSLIKTNLSASLHKQLRESPGHCYASTMRVSVRRGKAYFYPDVIVTDEDEAFEDVQFDTLINPVIIIEVLSPSTEAYVRGQKFLDYQMIPSLKEYVLVTQSPRRFEVFRRQPDDTWLYQSWPFSPPPLVLQSIGCTLTAEDVYFKVETEEGQGA
jgi:Uma2 family endonuclease